MAAKTVAKGVALGCLGLLAGVAVLDNLGAESVGEVSAQAGHLRRLSPGYTSDNKEAFHDGVNDLKGDLNKVFAQHKGKKVDHIQRVRSGFQRFCDGIENLLESIGRCFGRLLQGLTNMIDGFITAFCNMVWWIFFHIADVLYWFALNFIVRPIHFFVKLCYLDVDTEQTGWGRSCLEVFMVVGQIAFGITFYFNVVRRYPYWNGPNPQSAWLQSMFPTQAAMQASVSNIFLACCCPQAREAMTLDRTFIVQYWNALVAMFCCPVCTICIANAATDLNQRLGAPPRQGALYAAATACFCPCCVVAQDAESLDAATGSLTKACTAITPYEFMGMPDGGYGGYDGYDGMYGQQYPMMGPVGPYGPGYA